MNPFFLQFLSFSSQIIPAIAAVFYFRRLTKSAVILASFFYVSLITSSLNVYLALHRTHNLWVSNVAMPILFGLLIWFLSFSFERRHQRYALGLIVIFLGMWATDFIFFEPITGLSTIARPLECLLLTAVSCFVVAKIYRQNIGSFSHELVFWVASASILYYASNAMLFSMSGALLRISVDTLRLALSMQAIINIVTNLMYARGIVCLRHQ